MTTVTPVNAHIPAPNIQPGMHLSIGGKESRINRVIHTRDTVVIRTAEGSRAFGRLTEIPVRHIDAGVTRV